MGLYARHILPHVIDLACRHRDMFKTRQALVPQARGRVLEVGFGTGLNLSSYDTGQVERLWALEPHWEAMQAVADKRLRNATLEVEVLTAGAAAIPMPTDFFDSVVMTFTLCSIHEGEQALEEIRRVMKPGACLLFAEHGLAPEPFVRRQQRLLNPVWGACGGGCQLDRPMDRMITGAGFDVPDMQTGYLAGLRFASYVYSGRAYKR